MAMKHLARAALCCSIAILAGCANITTLKTTNAGTDKIDKQGDAAIDDARVTRANDDTTNTFVHTTGFYVPTEAVHAKKPTPVSLNCPFGANTPSGAVLVEQIVKRINDQCKIAVHFSADAQQFMSGTFGQRNGQAQSSTVNAGNFSPSAPAQTVPAPPVAQLTGGTQTYGLGGQQGSAGNRHNTVNINYSGTLSGFLDALTGQLGLSWRYNDTDNSVTIFYIESRTYTIDAIVSVTNVDSNVQIGSTASGGQGGSGGGGGGGSSGGASIGGNSNSTSTSGVTSIMSLSADVKSSVDNLLTPGVGSDSPISASTGTITVTDTPDALDRIQQTIDSFNHRLDRQMHFDVLVLSYTNTHNTDAGFNVTALFQDLASHYNIGIASNYQAAAASSTATLNVLQGNTHWSTSQAVLNALNQQGDASIKTESPLSTLNLQSATVQVAENKVYLAQSSVTGGTTTGSATQSALQPGSFTVGYSMALLPYALDDDKSIILKFNLNLSSQNGPIQTITSNGSEIQAPDINLRVLQQTVRLKVGQTLMLSGFQQTSLSVNRQGTGLPGVLNYVMGGGANTTNSKETLVILITPTYLD